MNREKKNFHHKRDKKRVQRRFEDIEDRKKICNVENDFFDDKSVVEDCILNIKRQYNTKTMIDNDCIDYSFINNVVAQKVCDALNINLLKLNKSKKIKEYDDRKEKNITH